MKTEKNKKQYGVGLKQRLQSAETKNQLEILRSEMAAKVSAPEATQRRWARMYNNRLEQLERAAKAQPKPAEAPAPTAKTTSKKAKK